MSGTQLELFQSTGWEHLFPYWRERLKNWPAEAWMFRHNRETTGWSVARQGYAFAQWLFSHGQMSREELKRWWRFSRRLDAWDHAARSGTE